MTDDFAPTGVFADLDDARVGALRRQFAELGVAVLGPQALATGVWSLLAAEALTKTATDAWMLGGSREQGEIGQWNQRARLGPCARKYLSSEAVISVLHAVIGERLTPSWSASCYTSYRGPDQFMGEHCDKAEACRFALLTYLKVEHCFDITPGAGLELHVYRGDNSSTGTVARIRSRANRVVILNGARQAHARPTLLPGEHVLMLAGCFRRAPGELR